MVQRFDLVSGYMQKWSEGNWVEYDDYAALENAVNALLANVKSRYPEQDLYCPFLRELERLTK